jgi:hypothetical protein
MEVHYKKKTQTNKKWTFFRLKKHGLLKDWTAQPYVAMWVKTFFTFLDFFTRLLSIQSKNNNVCRVYKIYGNNKRGKLEVQN